MTDPAELLKTPLHQHHIDHGAKMVPFAGYHMPVNYSPGVLKEHLHCRSQAGLFDVSHMGQILVLGDDIATRLETILPIDVCGLAPGKQKYALLLDNEGGVLDDLMVLNLGDRFLLVVNAGCKHQDLAEFKRRLGDQLQFELLEDRALLALQGPAAADAFSASFAVPTAELDAMYFMDVAEMQLDDADCIVSRSGYTGEDGFEISIPISRATALFEKMLAHPAVELVGLGARDSLRLEAGLCLYGQDLSNEITPIEAGLIWAISPARRSKGQRAGGFPGDRRILGQIDAGATRKLVGLMPQGRAPMRAGTAVFDDSQKQIGIISSGGFAPSLERPISMGQVDITHAAPGTKLLAEVRGKMLPLEVCDLPFVRHNYYRRTK